MEQEYFLSPGTTLWHGSYRIEKVLGKGGFGITYLATDLNLHNKVAIKEFFPQTFCNREGDTSHITVASVSNTELVEKLKQKFLKEARNIAKFNHPNIVKIHSAFEENDTAYYVMDFLAGENLMDKVRRTGPLPEAEAIEIIEKIGDALAYVHEKKINHLDVKPANIMLTADGTPILIDFGLSKQYDNAGSQTSTTPVGISHGFAPLEQYNADGVKDFSPRLDIYSLGATLYYLLTGTVPPPATTIFEEPLEFPQGFPPAVRDTIAISMSPAKGRRQASVRDFLSNLHSQGVDSEATTLIFEQPGTPAVHSSGAGNGGSWQPPQQPPQQPSRQTYDPEVINTPVSIPAPDNAKSGNKTLLYVLGGVLVFAVITLAILLVTRNSGNESAVASVAVEDTAAAAVDPADRPVEQDPDAEVVMENEKPRLVNNSPYPIAPGSHKFNGKAEGQYPIVVYLTVDSDGSVSGKMAYKSTLKKYGDSPDRYMRLNGFFSGSTLQMTGEYTNGNSEEWSLTCSDNGSEYKLKGNAYNYNRDKNFSISVSGT